MRFWKDSWLDGTSLQESYPLLFDICRKPDKIFLRCVQMNFNITSRHCSRIQPTNQLNGHLIAYHIFGVLSGQGD